MSDMPPPGYYRASDGQLYPVPAGYYLASDGQLYPAVAPPPPPAAPVPAHGAAPPWRWTAGVVTLLAGAAGTAVGSFLPWATAGPFSVNGTDGDGVLTLILAAVCGILGAAGARTGKVGFPIGAVIAAVLVVVIAVVDIADVAELADQPLIDVQIGGGLVLTLVGGVVAMVGGALAIARR